MSKLSILVVGDTDRSEFSDAAAAWPAMANVVRCRTVESAAAALSRETAAPDIAAPDITAPDIIVVAQSYPGQFSHEQVDRLRRLAPLARVVGLLGSWCEGEARTGSPWPAAVRTYWHQWLPRASRELGRLARGECSAWGLPVTSTEEERLLAGIEQTVEQRTGLIAIYTGTFAMEDWLSEACRRRGYATVWLRPPRPARVEGATAALFDGSDCHGEEHAQLEHLATTLAPAPIIALLHFPRDEDRRRALQAGAAAVVSKPFRLEDLYWQMDRTLEIAAGQ